MTSLSSDKQGFNPYQRKFIREGGERLSEVFERIHKSITEKGLQTHC